MAYCEPATKSNSVNQELSTLPHLNEGVSCAAVVSSHCLLCFPTSSCLLMSDTSMGTLTVTPSIHFLTHTWQPRRDLRRKHEVRFFCSPGKGRNPPPTVGCLVQDGFSRKLLLEICCPSRESSSQGTAVIQNKPHPLGKRCHMVRICLRGLRICCDQQGGLRVSEPICQVQHV